MGSKSRKQGSYLSFGSPVTLSVTLFRHLHPQFHSFNNVKVLFSIARLLQLWELLFPSCILLRVGGQVKGIGSEKSRNLFFEFGNIVFVGEGSLQDFAGEVHQGFVEETVCFLVGQNSGFELHVRVSFAHSCASYRCMCEHNPAVFISHFLGLFRQLFLFTRKNLWNRKASLLCLLLQDLLLVFESKEFSAVI